MNLANKITFSRILSVPLIILLMIKFRSAPDGEAEMFRYLTLFFFALAMISDAADGIIARRFNQKTRLGTILDPLADKFLLASSIIILCLSFDGVRILPYWFFVVAVSRDLLLVTGSLLMHYIYSKPPLPPSWIGKATTAAQMTLVVWILLGLPGPQHIWRAAGMLTLLSGIDYFHKGSKLLGEENDAQA